METTNRLEKRIKRTRGTGRDFERYVIKVKLDDDCKNGHEHFSLTADIYDRNEKYIGGGCCHEEILQLCPELLPFVRLHLSDQDGVPMHAVANAWFWYAGWQGGLGEKYHGGSGSTGASPDYCRRILGKHLRANGDDLARLGQCGALSQLDLQAEIEAMGFPDQWKAEAEKAIQWLERATGKRFETKASRKCFEPLTEEQKAIIAAERQVVLDGGAARGAQAAWLRANTGPNFDL